MKRQITAGLLSLGIAFAGVTAPKPARAGSEGVALIVTGALAVFALKEMFKDNSKQKKRKPTPTYSSRNPPKKYAKPHPHHPRRGKDRARGHAPNRGNYWKANRLVPGQCFYRYSARGGMRGVFGERCVSDIVGSARYLPNRCRRTEGRQFRYAPAYDAACLRTRGYRVEARR